MPFQLSPGVNVTEIDLTTIVPSVATTDAGFVGAFNWGPVDEITLVNNQETLVSTFGKPDDTIADYWFSASNFLDYGNKLHTVRVTLATANNARSKRPAPDVSTGLLIKNDEDFAQQATGAGEYLGGLTVDTWGSWGARYPGALGNNLRVSICDSYPGQFSNVVCNETANTTAGSDIVYVVSNNNFHIGDVVTFRTSVPADFAGPLNLANGPAGTPGTLPAGEFKVVSFPTGLGASATLANTVPMKLNKVTATTATNAAVDRKWEYYNNFDQVPGTSTYAAARGSANDEIHIAVSDATGLITGVKGQVLEKYPNVSKARDAKTDDGSSNYYADVINNKSKYIRFLYRPSTRTAAAGADADGAQSRDWGNTAFVAGVTNEVTESFKFIEGADQRDSVDPSDSKLWLPDTSTLAQGSDGLSTAAADYMLGYDRFADSEEIDISLLIAGPADGLTTRYIAETIAGTRKDCVAFISPNSADVTGNDTLSTKLANVKAYRLTDSGVDGINSLSTSYAVMDSGWKYQYDKFNDKYRWVPLNSDVAGLCVRTDESRDPWWSPAGFNRGHIKNVVRLAWNPQKAHRDELYKNGINPVVTIPGQGTILYGDKTLQAKPSAFDRINVRRLFIVLEKAIATAAKFTLFEFNDAFTRSQFVNMVEPFLRDVQGRRGIYDFKVVCDSTNNTGEVIDRNEFIGDIYIKPARSINFIQLNFVAVRTGVDFSEVVGKF
jgi:hypothetical protein